MPYVSCEGQVLENNLCRNCNRSSGLVYNLSQRFCLQISTYIHLQTSGLADLLLFVAKPSMEITQESEFLQSSFRTYQWREALLLSLARLTQGYNLKDFEEIRKETHVSKYPSTSGSTVLPLKFLTWISERKMVPMINKPHSFFFLCSEDNFRSACFDWIFWSFSNTQEMLVSAGFFAHTGAQAILKFGPGDCKNVYSSICRLSEETWSKWPISPETKDLLKFSAGLRADRKRWKTLAYQNRNRNRNQLAPGCLICGSLEASQRCIQNVIVYESDLNNTLENKLIIPTTNDVIELVSPKISTLI